MKEKTMREKTVENLLGINYPVLQGALGGISGPDLAAAVSRAGGLGTLASSTESGDSLAQKISKTRRLTGRPFAVNIPLRSPQAEDMVEIWLRERVKVVITAAGDPRIYTNKLREAGITVIHVVPTPQLALRAAEAGVNAVIAEGVESGGLASPYEIGTLALVPQVVDAVRIPVIAAGGIADARGYLAARVLGADGVSLGTAFLASRECLEIGQAYIDTIINTDASGTAIAARGVMPVRLAKNALYNLIERKIAEGGNKGEIISLRLAADQSSGENGFFSCGQGVGLIKEIKTVEEIIRGIIEGAAEIAERLAAGVPG